MLKIYQEFSWDFSCYVSPDNLAKVRGIFLILTLDSILQFSYILLFDYMPGIEHNYFLGEISFLNLAQQTNSIDL